jgi:hypothetical protein
MRKRKSVAIVRKRTSINMALTVATNVDGKALVGELALLNNVAILSKDAALLSNVALLGKIAALGKLAFLGKAAVLGKFTSWQSRANSPSSAKLPLGSLPAAGVDAGVALSSSRTLPWRRCHHCRRSAGVIADVALAVLWPPLHGRQCPPLGRPHFRVDLLDCLGFGSRPNSRAACFCGRRRPSLGLRLLGRPSGALFTQQGRLLVVI